MSSDLGGPAGPPVEQRDLVRSLHESALPPEHPPKIGVEVEWLPVDPRTGEAVPYGGSRGVEALYRRLEAHGFVDPNAAAHPTYLVRGRQSVNIEPGAQIEFGTSPLEDLHQVAAEIEDFGARVAAIAAELGFALIGYGVQPLSRAEAIAQVPKRRYDIMVEHFRAHGGTRFLDMMRQSASVQVNLDYRDEVDAGRKLCAATWIAPVLQALCANAPIYHGAEATRPSERVEIWRHTDAARCGALPVALAGPHAWSFEALVETIIDIPALVVRAPDGGLMSARGRSFRELLARGVDGRRAELADWDLFLSAIFTDARLKRRVVECRAPDTLPPAAIMSIPALYVGVLYDEQALHAVLERFGVFAARYDEAVAAVAARGLEAQVAGRPVRAFAETLLRLAREGLERRGRGEARYLAPLEGALAPGASFAERARAAYREGGLPALVASHAVAPAPTP